MLKKIARRLHLSLTQLLYPQKMNKFLCIHLCLSNKK